VARLGCHNKPRPLLTSFCTPIGHIQCKHETCRLVWQLIVRTDNLKVAERHFICKYIAFIVSWIIYGGSICCC